MNDLESRLNAAIEIMKVSEAEFNQATQCLVDSLQAIHHRLERMEKWIENEKKKETTP